MQNLMTLDGKTSQKYSAIRLVGGRSISDRETSSLVSGYLRLTLRVQGARAKEEHNSKTQERVREAFASETLTGFATL